MEKTQEELLERIDSAMNFGEPEDAAAVLAAALRGLSDRGREVAEALATLPEENGLVQWQLEEALAHLEELKLKA